MGKKIGETKPQFLIQKVQVIFVALFELVITHIWHTKNGTKLVQQFVQNCSRYMAKSSIKDIADPVSPHFSRTKSMKQLLTAFPVSSRFCVRTPYGSDFAGMGIAGQWWLVCEVRTLSGALYLACCSV